MRNTNGKKILVNDIKNQSTLMKRGFQRVEHVSFLLSNYGLEQKLADFFKKFLK